MDKIKYAVTGATGHIGYALAKELNDAGCDFRLLIRKAPGYLGDFNCEFALGDVTDAESLKKAFEGCGVVFHLAGCIEIRKGYEDTLRKVNVEGTKNVVEACIACGVKRLVYMSSTDVYPSPSEYKMGAVIREQKRFYPERLEGAYAKTKAEATNYVLAANGRGGLETVVLHPSACMGPYDYKVSSIGSMVRMCMRFRLPVTMDFGAYDFVDVRDVAKATFAAAERGRAGETYILAGEHMPVGGFIEALDRICVYRKQTIRMHYGFASFIAPAAEIYYKLSGQTPLFTPYAVRKLVCGQIFSSDKARRELSFDPRSAFDSLKDMVAWIEENEG